MRNKCGKKMLQIKHQNGKTSKTEVSIMNALVNIERDVIYIITCYGLCK